jgi:predicted ATPase
MFLDSMTKNLWKDIVKTIAANHYLLEVGLLRKKVPKFSEYPFSLPGVSNLKSLKMHPAVTFLVGENGSGKSTLLEAIAVSWGFNAEGGSQNFNFESRASHSNLHKYVKLKRGLQRPRDGFFFRAESFFNVATNIEKIDRENDPYKGSGPPVISYFGGKSLHEQSHGESFLALMMHRFGGKGLYILDEPEAALSPSRQMAMLSRMHDLVKQKSQFIIATHSPIIMSYPNATIYLLTEKGIEPIKYTDTEHYSVAKEFLNNHKKMLDLLIRE